MVCSLERSGDFSWVAAGYYGCSLAFECMSSFRFFTFSKIQLVGWIG